MRRLALLALFAAAACNGTTTSLESGPADQFYKPMGLAVYGGKLLVASSNADLLYDDLTGGTVISVDPALDPAPLAGTVNIRSFAGQLTVADPAACPAMADPGAGAVGLVAVRGDDVLYRLRISEAGALSCDGCEAFLAGAGWADAFAIGLACAPGTARAYVGFLRSSFGQTVISQVDLAKRPGDPGFVQTREDLGAGLVSAFAFDAPRSRLYFTRTTTGASGTLGWVDLANGCGFTAPEGETPCPSAAVLAPSGLELRGVALATSEAAPRRVYLTAREYDAASGVSLGGRVGDYGGRLLVAEVVEDLAGVPELRVLRQVESLGHNPTFLVTLPPRAGKRDVVATLAADDGVLWIYDDDSGEVVQIGLDPTTGAPLIGRTPFGLAADPIPVAGPLGPTARLYVGSFGEGFVTAIDVPLDDVGSASIVQSGGAIRRITGGVR